jgi:copper chaperone
LERFDVAGKGRLRLIPWRGIISRMSQTVTYTVSGMHCGHCESAVKEEVGTVLGVSSVEVDLETKLVRVTGESVDDAAVRAAIDEAGYEAA